MSRIGFVVPWLIGFTALGLDAPAKAQGNIDAGRSPAQIFAETCSACHRSPRELKRSGAGFLRSHYSAGAEEASAMAAYLASIGNDPRAVQQRRPSVAGAAQAPGETANPANRQAQPREQAKSTPGQPQAKGRRQATAEARVPAAAPPPEDKPPESPPAPAPPKLEPFEE